MPSGQDAVARHHTPLNQPEKFALTDSVIIDTPALARVLLPFAGCPLIKTWYSTSSVQTPFVMLTPWGYMHSSIAWSVITGADVPPAPSAKSRHPDKDPRENASPRDRAPAPATAAPDAGQVATAGVGRKVPTSVSGLGDVVIAVSWI